MKRVFIAILLIMAVFCASAFAKNGFDNYSGLSVGYGFSHADIQRGGLKWEEKSQQVTITFTDYAFVERSPIGIYANVGLFIPTVFSIDDYETNGLGGLVCALGPSFKFEAGKKVDVLMGLGFQYYTNTEELTSTAKLESNYFGICANVQTSYNLGKHFAITFGVTGSLLFSNYRQIVYKYWNYPDDVSYDEYLEYRVIPEISAYFVY